MLDKNKVEETIQDLHETKERILARHEGDSTFMLRVESVFNQLINSLAGVTGNLVNESKSSAFNPTPLSYIAGTKIEEKAGPVVFEPIKIDQAEELRKQIEFIKDSFPSRENSELLENLNEFQIRGVAKVVGLADFEEAPIDAKLIQAIKDKIQANADEIIAKNAAKDSLKDPAKDVKKSK